MNKGCSNAAFFIGAPGRAFYLFRVKVQNESTGTT